MSDELGPAGLDLGALLRQASSMQEQLMAAQDELADARVEGSAGGGLVRATVTGTGELVDLTISPAACDPADTETLADLVIAAVRDAVETAQRRAGETMSDITGALPSLGDLGGLADAGGFAGFVGGAPAEEAEPDERESR